MCRAASQMRIQPDEAIYMKMVLKKPGLEMDAIVSEMDLSYKQRYSESYIPDAYERLLLDALRGDQQHFVRRCGPDAEGDAHTTGRRCVRGVMQRLDKQSASAYPPEQQACLMQVNFPPSPGA